jgi:hypothetical protein
MAVPPDVDGEHCKMSLKGGNWDELKRILSWAVDSLNPGQAIEIQAQFPQNDDAVSNDKEPKFPVLVRFDYPVLFSTVTVVSDGSINIDLSKSSRVLHRKV